MMSGGCGSESASATAGTVKTATGTDAGAMADLQTSPKWTEPRCRWLETGAHLLLYPQDTAVLMAARDLGYVEVEQVGTGNRIGTPEPAWSVRLTDKGKTESAKCGSGSSRAEVFGVPVSQRRFISAKRTGEPDMYNPNRTVFEIEFEWVPTAVGELVKNVLTSHMAVEQGLAKAQASMLYGDRVTNTQSNGWTVQAINETRKAAGQ
jgi:hypothetical protein